MSTFSKKFGIPITNDNPDGTSAQENQAVGSLKGDPRAPDVLDVSPSFAIQGANEGLYAKYFSTKVNKVPRAMKDGRATGWATTGARSRSARTGTSSRRCRGRSRTCSKPDYKNKVALNGSPLTSGSAVAGVFAAAIANGGSLSNIQPGIDYFAKLKKIGNFIPVQATPQTVAPGRRRS